MIDKEKIEKLMEQFLHENPDGDSMELADLCTKRESNMLMQRAI